MTGILPLLAASVAGTNLSEEEAARAFQIVLSGGATPAQIAAFLIALKMKGEAVLEIVGAVRAMRAKAQPFPITVEAIDVCGTGGDGLATYNVSTAVALVVAGCGVPVIKHGNRAVSSRSGSSDILQALGVEFSGPIETMREAFEQTGLAFLFAPNHHPSLRHVQPIRQELKLRTIFNLLGPLANPAQVRRQLMGVYDRALLDIMAQALLQLGSEAAWVVHGEDGMDECSLTGSTEVRELRDGKIRSFTFTPEEAGLERCALSDLLGGDATYNAQALDRLLAGQKSAYRDIVLLNAAAALIVAGRTERLVEGVAMAAQSIDSHAARGVLTTLSALTQKGIDGVAHS